MYFNGFGDSLQKFVYQPKIILSLFRMNYLEINALVYGVLQLDNDRKQQIGRRLAAHLGLTPGALGPDKGIDGEKIYNGKRIYFQSKLSREPLSPSLAAEFFGYLVGYAYDIGIMLSGTRYTDGFKDRLEYLLSSDRLKGDIKVHLLSLEDIFGETEVFQNAALDLPPLRDLSNGGWCNFELD